MKEYSLNNGKILNIIVSAGRLKGKYVSTVLEFNTDMNIIYITPPRFANLYVPLKKDNNIIVNFLEGKMLCRFNSTIIKIHRDSEDVMYEITGPHEIEENNKRTSLRVPVPFIKINIKNENLVENKSKVFMCDVSVKGAKIELDQKLEPNQIIYLTFDLPNNKSGAFSVENVKAKLVWQKIIEDRLFAGIEFLNLTEHKETTVMNYILQVQRAHNWDKHLEKIIGPMY